jgi:tetratricopeptide (TPR) repeat protein
MGHTNNNGIDDLSTPEERLRKGEALFEEERWSEAEETFRHILAAYPDNPQALNDLACLLWKTHRIDEALQALRKALKVAPEDRDIFWNCGQILIGLGFIEDALLLYELFLKEFSSELLSKPLFQSLLCLIQNRNRILWSSHFHIYLAHKGCTHRFQDCQVNWKQ